MSGTASKPGSGGGAAAAATEDAASSGSCGILDYLQSSLARSTLLQLYTDESRGRFVCRAVLQQLSTVAQQLVVRVSCCGGRFDIKGVQVWFVPNCNLKAILDELEKWSILDKEHSYPMVASSKHIILTEEFSKGLKECLSSMDTSPWTPLTAKQLADMEKEKALEEQQQQQQQPQKKKRKTEEIPLSKITIEFLERYTQTQWDAVLHFLVGTPNMSIKPPPAVIQFLEETGLMQNDPEYTGWDKTKAPLVITQKGYDFMLQDNHQQVWHFVVQYLKSLQSVASQKPKNAKKLSKEALLLLVCLGFAKVGEAYLTAALTKRGRVMVEDLALFGLIYVRKIGKYTIFYPTRVALQLVGSNSSDNNSSSSEEDAKKKVTNLSSVWALSSKALNEALSNPTPQGSSHLAIIVQTNFQLCAYTTSELHISMLGLFCDVQTIRRLPNVVFMIITRDSIKAAFSLGIQAYQIIKFMEKHAHPKLRNPAMQINDGSMGGSFSPIPSNVIDQIWLWDRERHRIEWSEVYSHQCTMIEAGEFQAVVQFAKDAGAYAYGNEDRKQLLIHYSHAEKVQTFARQWRAKKAKALEAEGL